MAELMYERSKDHIEWLQPYKQPWLDSIMHLLSFLGQGDPYAYFFIFIWALKINNKNANSQYEINYFMISLFAGMNVSYLLKPVFHMSRPYFDNISLGDTILKDCSAEFGNPSAHSVMAGQSPLTFMWYYFLVYKEYFDKHRF